MIYFFQSVFIFRHQSIHFLALFWSLSIDYRWRKRCNYSYSRLVLFALLYITISWLSIFFRQILTNSETLSVSIIDLISTVAEYFETSTAMAKREAEIAALFICDSVPSNPRGSLLPLPTHPITYPIIFTLIFVLTLNINFLIAVHPITIFLLNFFCA